MLTKQRLVTMIKPSKSKYYFAAFDSIKLQTKIVQLKLALYQ